MGWVIISLVAISASGCYRGTVLTGPQFDRIKQDISDSRAVNDPSVPPSEYTKDINATLAEDMRKSLDIELDELPKARVSVNEWVDNEQDAHRKNRGGIEKEPVPESYSAMLGGLATIATLFGLGLVAKTGGPLGMASELLSTWLIAKNPKDAKVQEIIFKAIELYKESDPNWAKNPLMMQISALMPLTLKDHIKTKIVATI
jgi:hypothetical protein